MRSAAALPIRVLIADDHRLFAEALSVMLDGAPGIEVAGYAWNGKQAVELAGSLHPDVVLMDISMPVMDGFEAAESLRKRRDAPAVLMLTGSNAPQDVARARDAGAAGYLTKDSIAADLVGAIRDAVAR